jgi:hypothetical protein
VNSTSRGVVAAGAGAGLLAGAAAVAYEVTRRVSTDPDFWDCNSAWDYLINGEFALAFLMLPVTMYAMRALLRAGSTTAGTYGLVIGASGAAVAAVGNTLEHCANSDFLGLFFPPAVIAAMAGLALLGIAAARTKVLPPWIGWALAASALGTLFTAESGGGVAIVGAVLVLVGAVLGIRARKLIV